ncbi:AI-2E family transporter [Allosphingosinicella flava]|uniref:AI-2E family transporter n=1 Tax=Allosphingosinicella flava TaxID=2771430 RepID=A0A7T2GLS8_9SPHN|nr:AI-2E family transporter [Sphingosinicella flava]QPQ56136.1 AI-2E family transporter [Sphingosinicella flava]
MIFSIPVDTDLDERARQSGYGSTTVTGAVMTAPKNTISHRVYVERLCLTLLIGGLALIFWQIRDVLILIFAAVLVGVIFRILANPIERRLHIPRALALAIAVTIMLTLLAASAWLFGAEIVAQSSTLEEAIPRAWTVVLERLDAVRLGQPARAWVKSLGEGDGVLSGIGGIALSFGSGLADALLVLFGGIYLAAQPDLYRRGVIKLIPPRGRGLAARALDDSWKALRLWLIGRLVSMSVVGILTGIGLSIIGIPAALTLGILSGILEFVPFIGPIISAIPAVLLALAVDPEAALWTIGLYLVVQQIEGNLLEPLVQQRAVSLPPALLLFSIVIGGLLFGIPGILVAAPLLVVIYVMVKRLYVRTALHTRTPIPGEKAH